MAELTHIQFWGLILVMIFFMSSEALLIRTTRVDGKYPYNPISVTLVTEAGKWLVCLVVLLGWKQRDFERWRQTFSLRESVVFLVPAVIYTINNTLVFFVNKLVEPPVFAIFNNMKLITTAIAHRLVLKSQLHGVKAASIILLATGVCISQIECGASYFAGSMFEAFCLSLVTASLSAIANIWTEYFMKKDDITIYIQNLQLYSYGIATAVLTLYFSESQAQLDGGFFRGWSPTVYTIVVNNVLCGLVIGAVIKFADNIVKNFASCVSIILTAVVSSVLFDFTPSMNLILGGVVVLTAVYLYGTPPPAPPPAPVNPLLDPTDTKV